MYAKSCHHAGRQDPLEAMEVEDQLCVAQHLRQHWCDQSRYQSRCNFSWQPTHCNSDSHLHILWNWLRISGRWWTNVNQGTVAADRLTTGDNQRMEEVQRDKKRAGLNVETLWNLRGKVSKASKAAKASFQRFRRPLMRPDCVTETSSSQVKSKGVRTRNTMRVNKESMVFCVFLV